ncbi:MarR family winged helix-turn-helix transcriptional regulator [Segnochrobactrum spirostomi]|nr:MarR family transcriptional regulator [Segnochrobactrum spirostomi]
MRTPEGEALSGIVWRILQVESLLVEIGNRLAAPFGLTAARWQVMGSVPAEPLSVAEIARRLSLARQGVQRIADELVADGFAAYVPNPHHARAKLFGLTQKGRDSYAALMKEQADWMNGLADGLAIGDLAAAHRILEALETRLRRQTAP